MEGILIYGIIFLYGTMIGSFLNVCIFRIPKRENIAIGRSHCMNCNNNIRWYDLVPVISFILLRGKCRACKSEISVQYPMVEALNGFLYMAIFNIYGWKDMNSIILNVVLCLTTSTLIVISFIDISTYTIPRVLNFTLLLLSLFAVIFQYFVSGRELNVLIRHGIGFFTISVFLLIVFFATQGRGIGGGDVKLMAGAGLLLGWDVIIVAFILGCILASIIHPILIRIRKLEKVLAFGPYLSAGIMIGILFGNRIIDWYITTFIGIY